MARTVLLSRILGAGLLVLAAAPAAPAGPVASWSYSAAVGGPGIVPQAGQYNQFLPYGFPSGRFETEIAVALIDAYGSGTSVQGSRTLFLATAQGGGSLPDSINAARIGFSYDMALSLTDLASGKSGVVSVSGTLSNTALNPQVLANAFSSPATQSLVLGGNRYTVTFAFVPNPSYATYVPGGGRMTADVQVSGAAEPCALALAGLGLVGAGLAAWRRRSATARAACAGPRGCPRR